MLEDAGLPLLCVTLERYEKYLTVLKKYITK